MSEFAVIFDMDGVLLDSERAYIDAYMRFASGYEDIKATTLACIGANGAKTREIFLGKYGEDFPFDSYYRQVTSFVRSHPVPLKPYAEEILIFLSENHIPIALASSTNSAAVHRMLDTAGLTGYFDRLICGDMVSHSKPHPEIFLAAAQALGIAPASCMVVEDSYNGIRGAAAAGMHPLMVPDIVQPDDEIRALCDGVFPTLYEAQEYFFERIL